MGKSGSARRKIAKKRIEKTIENLLEQIEQLKIDLEEFSSEESSEEEGKVVQVGDKVESLTAPWYNGIVESISRNDYWVYIRIGKSVKKKAAHNVRVVGRRTV